MEKFAYIGCRTTKERKARGKGISVYKVDGDNWELVQILEGQVNPSYLCLNKAQDRLYSIHGDFCQVCKADHIPQAMRLTHFSKVIFS